LIYALGATAMVTRRREIAVACLAELVTVDLLDPLVSVIWGD
jgi:hypothetical protein